MTRIDRYILVLFLRTVLITFCSLGGVFVVFHAFHSMDELTRRAESSGGWFPTLISSYGPLLLLLFDWTGAIITLMAFLFTAGWLRHTGELTATLAAGVSHGRILRPMVMASAAIIMVQLANRELVLPHFRDSLTMKSKDLDVNAAQPVTSRYDRINGILIDGSSLVATEKRITEPSFLLYGDFDGFGDLLTGTDAVWLAASDKHPDGFLVQDVQRPESVSQVPTVYFDGRPILMTATDQDWLNPDECFVATRIGIDLLQSNSTATKQASVLELVGRVCNPAVHSSDALRVYLHERVVRVPLDMALVLLVLPLVVNRRQQNLFVCIGAAIGIVVFFFGLKTVAGGMAGSGYVLSPAMAAWIPLLVIGPVAYVRYRFVQTV
ncbi:LptF/LptG family permease [Crateriforma spongiae]|uniref:LptF/LptG family permease n=1 Tax=Crateriforma spongiae TaxID=2724528 RepID=UPI00144624B1|nr:LptF/LptG family permease [Crateriforma spongiae]